MNKKTPKSNTKQPGGRQLSRIAWCSFLVVALTPSAGFADFAVADDKGTSVTATPWLAGVTTNSVYVCVDTDSTANATVNYGLTTARVSSATTESIDETEEEPAYLHDEEVGTGTFTSSTTTSLTDSGADYSGLVDSSEYVVKLADGTEFIFTGSDADGVTGTISNLTGVIGAHVQEYVIEEEVVVPSVTVSYVHNVKLTGLLPDKVYNYQVTHGGSVSANYTFRTAPEPGTAARFAWAADSRAGGNGATGVHNKCAGHLADMFPNMIIYGGDIAYGSSYGQWTEDWFGAGVPNQVALNSTVPFVNAVGNHEGWVKPDDEGGALHKNTPAFTESPSGTDGEGGEGYFSFDYGDVHILVLNNYVDYGVGSNQWNFAAADLANSTAKFKIVASHKPPIAYGKHNGDGGMDAMATALFEPNGVDIVISGHNHYYQRNWRNGIHYMVVGAFGSSLKDPAPPDPAEFHLYSEKTQCFAIFETDGGNTLTLQTYRWTADLGNGVSELIEEIVVTAATDPDDTDGDGLLDSWETSFPGLVELTDLTGLKSGPGPGADTGDFDGDGSSDLTEFRLGLNPTDPNSTFTLDVSPGLAAGTVDLSWPSQEGLDFEIRFTDDLSLPLANWDVISPITDDDDDGAPTHEWNDADAALHPWRFYRAGLLP